MKAPADITPPPVAPAPTVRPDSALSAIRLMIGPIPAVILAAGIFLAYKFPIAKAGHEETLRQLATQNAMAAE